jgi:hypothetical protein
MNTNEISYLVFGVVLLLAVGFDLGLAQQKRLYRNYPEGPLANDFLGRACLCFFWVYLDVKRAYPRIRIYQRLFNGMEPER